MKILDAIEGLSRHICAAKGAEVGGIGDLEDGKDVKSKGASMDLADQFLPEVDIIGNVVVTSKFVARRRE